jgi:hypothetical protein
MTEVGVQNRGDNHLRYNFRCCDVKAPAPPPPPNPPSPNPPPPAPAPPPSYVTVGITATGALEMKAVYDGTTVSGRSYESAFSLKNPKALSKNVLNRCPTKEKSIPNFCLLMCILRNSCLHKYFCVGLVVGHRGDVDTLR